MTTPKRPRWRCDEPGCWAREWQSIRPATVRMYPSDDPLDVAVAQLEAHYAREHKESK